MGRNAWEKNAIGDENTIRNKNRAEIGSFVSTLGLKGYGHYEYKQVPQSYIKIFVPGRRTRSELQSRHPDMHARQVSSNQLSLASQLKEEFLHKFFLGMIFDGVGKVW